MKVGVLAIQGDYEAHQRLLDGIGVGSLQVRTPEDLSGCDALIIPGGESTTIRIVGERAGLIEPLRSRARGGMPILGTCAGMIACAAEIADGDEPILGCVDITVRRNAYGRQVASFEAELDWTGIGTIDAVFIRAPRVERIGSGVEVLASHGRDIVAVRQGQVTLVSFHPELTGDDRIHRAFLDR